MIVNGKLTQKYAARHLTRRNRFLFSIVRDAMHKQLVLLRQASDNVRPDYEQPALNYFRHSHNNDYLVAK